MRYYVRVPSLPTLRAKQQYVPFLHVILIPLLAAEGGKTGITAISTGFVDGRRLPSPEDIEELVLNKERGNSRQEQGDAVTESYLW